MAKETENGFIYPEYGDKADIPSLMQMNAEKVEYWIAYYKGVADALHGNIESINGAIAVINTQLGIIADEIDAVNGVEA